MSLPTTIKDFLELVRYGSIDNSYKMVWSKAIVDLCTEKPNSTSILINDIADKIIGYYWNLHIFFDPDGRMLREGNNSSKRPVVLAYVLSLISDYKAMKSEYKPCFYEALSAADKKYLSISHSKVSKDLKKDVRFRFLKSGKDVKSIYDYKINDDKLIFDSGVCKEIANHQDILHEAILFRWTQILEDINRTTPRIAAKLKLRQEDVKRSSNLKKFHPWLLIENPSRKCALCKNVIINEKELSVDHVIPWSFLYSDDIWNFSFVHKTCNSSKNNTPPKKKEIDAQNSRNIRLLNLIESQHQDKAKGKIYKELKIAVDENMLNKMWSIYKV